MSGPRYRSLFRVELISADKDVYLDENGFVTTEPKEFVGTSEECHAELDRRVALWEERTKEEAGARIEECVGWADPIR